MAWGVNPREAEGKRDAQGLVSSQGELDPAMQGKTVGEDAGKQHGTPHSRVGVQT